MGETKVTTRDYIVGISIMVGITAVIFLGALFIPYTEHTYYMPNGVTCDYKQELRGAIEFSYCSDGKDYINPEYYDDKKKSKK